MREKKDNILFFVEGQTEQAVLSALNILGKTDKRNLWHIDSKKIIRLLKPNTTLYIVYDTDELSQCQRFINNLKQLDKEKKVVSLYLIQQTHNLEDELVYACSISKPKLRKEFKAQNDDELKSKINQCTSDNLFQKLSKLGLNTDKLWTGKHIAELADWENYRVTFQDLELK